MNLNELFPRASKDFLKLHGLSNLSDRPPSRPIVERLTSPRPLAKAKAQKPDTGRVLVRVVSYRRRLLDEDNLSEKYFVDCCRYAGLIPGDGPEQTKIEVSQVKVVRKEEERTQLTITYPTSP
jgi:hypothetical protein